MFQTNFSYQRPSSAELHRWARIERSRALALFGCGVARALATKTRVLARAAGRLARRFMTLVYQRSMIRALQRLDDVTLADLGVPRCETESIVREGRSVRPVRKRDHQDWRHFPPRWQAAMRHKLPQLRDPRITDTAA